MKLFISEIFKSIQGESSFAGKACAFVRLAECNLSCAWCDTRYAWRNGKGMGIREILGKVRRLKCPRVEITGGEPLLQEGVFLLLDRLVRAGYTVLLETNGSLLLKRVPRRVHVIMDIKTPSSGMAARNSLDNLRFLKKSDEVKFVVADRGDLRFAENLIRKYRLDRRFSVLVSPVAGRMALRRAAAWCLRKGLDVRLNLQIHKIIWPSGGRGV